MEHLRDAVLRLDVMAAVGLRAVDELELLALAHARHRAQPRELLLQAVLALDRADENPVLLAVVVRLGAHSRFSIHLSDDRLPRGFAVRAQLDRTARQQGRDFALRAGARRRRGAVGVLAALFATSRSFSRCRPAGFRTASAFAFPSCAARSPWRPGSRSRFTVSEIHWLFVCPALIGLGHIFFHVSIHNLVGSLGAEAERTRNFSTFALGSAIAAFIGPSLAGFAIDLAGFRPAFAILAVVAAAPAIVVLVYRSLIPAHVRHEEEEQAKSASIRWRSRRCAARSS